MSSNTIYYFTDINPFLDVKCGRECGQPVSPSSPSVSLKNKKSLKTNGFQGFNVVEISGIEPLTS